MGLDVTMNVSVSDTGGAGGRGKWRAPKDDIIQVVKPKGARNLDQDEVSDHVRDVGGSVAEKNQKRVWETETGKGGSAEKAKKKKLQIIALGQSAWFLKSYQSTHYLSFVQMKMEASWNALSPKVWEMVLSRRSLLLAVHHVTKPPQENISEFLWF